MHFFIDNVIHDYQIHHSIYYKTKVLDPANQNCIHEYVGPEYLVFNKKKQEYATLNNFERYVEKETVLNLDLKFENFDTLAINNWTKLNCQSKAPINPTDLVNVREDDNGADIVDGEGGRYSCGLKVSIVSLDSFEIRIKNREPLKFENKVFCYNTSVDFSDRFKIFDLFSGKYDYEKRFEELEKRRKQIIV